MAEAGAEAEAQERMAVGMADERRVVEWLMGHADRQMIDGPHRFAHMSCRNELAPGRKHHNQVHGTLAEATMAVWR